METRVQLKNLYLTMVVAIGLIGLGIGSTFAILTASSIIENPIALGTNLSSVNALFETVEVMVPANDIKSVDLVISNTSDGSLNYSAWYSSSSNDLEIGSISSSVSYGTTGTLPTGANFTLTVQLVNNSNSNVVVTLGVSSSVSSIILSPGSVVIPANELPPIASISAVFTQGNNVIYDMYGLDTLKQYLVVTATNYDGTQDVIPGTDYTLSGLLEDGTSVITATYLGRTATFNVDVTGILLYKLENESVTTSTKISTNVDLISSDIDYSICFDGTLGTKNGAYKVLYHWENASPWRGLTVGRSNTTSEVFAFKYMGTTVTMTGISATSLSTIKFVITHQSGSGEAKIYYRANGDSSTTTKTVTASYAALTPLSGGLSFGYHTSDNNWSGTINRAYACSIAFTAAQAEAFITGA